jgi:lipopolysaccharide transport system ATP-binding protein
MDVIATIYNEQGAPLTSLSTRHLGMTVTDISDQGRFVCRLPRLPLLPGSYRVAIALQCGGNNLDLVPNAVMLNVSGSEFFPSGRVPDPRYCTFFIAQEWEHASTNEVQAPALRH